MAIAEVFIKEAEALLAPIFAAEPGGKNPSTDERYQELRVEVDKENSPIGEAVGWPRVEGLGREILGKVAKDLLVAAYTAFALHKTRGMHGLAVGVLVVDGLLDRFWDTMYPPVARLKGRGTALKWLIEHAAGVVDSKATPEDEGVFVIRLGDPLVLPLRDVGTRDRGVVAAGPATQRYLDRESRQREARPQPRAAAGFDERVAREHGEAIHRMFLGALRQPQPQQHPEGS